MNIYSDWILVDKDRSCDLCTSRKVVIMDKNTSFSEAELCLQPNGGDPAESWEYRYVNGKWADYVFAYKILLTPEKTESAYNCYIRFNSDTSAIIFEEEEAPEYVRTGRDYEYGTATEVTMNGRPISFHWEKDTK